MRALWMSIEVAFINRNRCFYSSESIAFLNRNDCFYKSESLLLFTGIYKNGHQGDKASFILMVKIAHAYHINIEDFYHLEYQYQKHKGV